MLAKELHQRANNEHYVKVRPFCTMSKVVHLKVAGEGGKYSEFETESILIPVNKLLRVQTEEQLTAELKLLTVFQCPIALPQTHLHSWQFFCSTHLR